MDILKTLGKIGAIAAAGVGLILAGKSELGSGLFKKDDDLETDDLQQVPIPEQTETEIEVVEEKEEEEEETPE